MLMAIGLIVIFSGSNQNFARVSSQVVNMTVALGVMYAFANIPPHYLRRIALSIYVLGVLLLVCVALFGEFVNGARRWLDVRFAVEFTREPDSFLGLLALNLSMGQWLSLPMVLAGICLAVWASRHTQPGSTSPH